MPATEHELAKTLMSLHALSRAQLGYFRMIDRSNGGVSQFGEVWCLPIPLSERHYLRRKGDRLETTSVQIKTKLSHELEVGPVFRPTAFLILEMLNAECRMQ